MLVVLSAFRTRSSLNCSLKTRQNKMDLNAEGTCKTPRWVGCLWHQSLHNQVWHRTPVFSFETIIL